MPEIYRLRIYEDDGVTVAVEYSTDPAHARPYLQVPDTLTGQTLDFTAGRATIGSVTVEIVDVGDDATGRLSGADGLTALIGRRAHLEILTGAVYENVKNGPIDDVELHDSYSAFTLVIKDQRENERRTRAFTRATTSSILPRGVIDGFGLQPDGEYLVPPTTPLRASYEAFDAFDPVPFPLGVLAIKPHPAKNKDGDYLPAANQIITEAMRDAFRIADYEGVPRYVDLRLHWRLVGASEWNIIDRPRAAYTNPITPLPGVFQVGEEFRAVEWLNVFEWYREDAEQPHPADGDTLEIIFGFGGEPSEEYPLHLEGPRGEIAAAMLDGDYSEGGATVRYDATAMAARTEPILARIMEPLDDEDGIRSWMEENIWAPWGDAPAEDENGDISPVSDAPPDVAEVLVQLDDSNCDPFAGWSHGGADAINVVEIKYQRLYRVPEDADPTARRSAGDGLAARDVTMRHENIASIALLGEKPLKLEPVTLCAIGGTDGDPITGDVADEYGAQVAKARTRSATDRHLMGGQHFAVRAIRSLTGAIRPGQWFTGACSWWPDYATGTRGGNRLLQAVRVQRADSIGYELALIDAGPDNAPVGQPTIDPLSAVVNADGSVTVDVTAIAADSEARIDYAISDTEPPQASPLWRFADRIDAVGSVSTPANPAGGVVWIRGRGEAEGRRASAWTAAFSTAIPETPRVRGVRVTVDRLGLATVTYSTNAFTGGVRVYYDAHGPRAAATFTDYQDFDATGEAVLDALTVRAGETLDVKVEAWGGFAAGAVVAPQGEAVYARTAMPTDASALGLSKFGARKKAPEYVVVGGIPGALVEAVLVFDKLYEEPGDGEEITTPEVLAGDVPADVLDPIDADASGFVTYQADRPARGFQRYIFFIPVSADEEGATYTLRIDPKEGHAPYFDRIAQTGLLSVDFFGRVNDPETGAGGGTLSVWLPSADFEGAPSGTLDLAESNLPFSFGPSTVFDAGALLNNIPSDPRVRAQLGIQYDTADGRTTGQMLYVLEGHLGDLIDEFGQIRTDSWLNAYQEALADPGIYYSNDPPVDDGDTYQRWYQPSTNTVFQWDGDSWEVLEGHDYIVAGSAIIGKLVVGAVTAEAVSTGFFSAASAEIYDAVIEHMLTLGGLRLVGTDSGAIVHGILQNAAGTAGMDLDAAGTDPFLWHPAFELLADGSATFSGDLSAATGTFAGALSAATGTFRGDLHIKGFGNSINFYDASDVVRGSITFSDLGTPGDAHGINLQSGASLLLAEEVTEPAGQQTSARLSSEMTQISGSHSLHINGLDVVGLSAGAADSGGSGFKLLRIPN